MCTHVYRSDCLRINVSVIFMYQFFKDVDQYQINMSQIPKLLIY
jgi:hypothetical protein